MTNISSDGMVVLFGNSSISYPSPITGPVPMRNHLTCNCCLLYYDNFTDDVHSPEWTVNSGSWDLIHTPNPQFPWITDSYLEGDGWIEMNQQATTPSFVVDTSIKLEGDNTYKFKIGTDTIEIDYDSTNLIATVSLNDLRVFHYYYVLWNNWVDTSDDSDTLVFYPMYDPDAPTPPPNPKPSEPGWTSVSIWAWCEEDDTDKRTIVLELGGAIVQPSGWSVYHHFRFDEPLYNTGNNVAIGCDSTGQFGPTALYSVDTGECDTAPKCENCLYGCEGYSLFLEVENMANALCDNCECQFKNQDGTTRTIELAYGASNYPYDSHCKWLMIFSYTDWCYYLTPSFFSVWAGVLLDNLTGVYTLKLVLDGKEYTYDFGLSPPDCSDITCSSWTPAEGAPPINGQTSIEVDTDTNHSFFVYEDDGERWQADMGENPDCSSWYGGLATTAGVFHSVSAEVSYDDDAESYTLELTIGDQLWEADLGTDKPDCTQLNLSGSDFTCVEKGTVCDPDSATITLWSEPTTPADPPDLVYRNCDCDNGESPQQLELTVSGIVDKTGIPEIWDIPNSSINGTYVLDRGDIIGNEYVVYGYEYTVPAPPHTPPLPDVVMGGIDLYLYFDGRVIANIGPFNGNQGMYFDYSITAPYDCSDINWTLKNLRYLATTVWNGFEQSTVSITNV